jgi:hypothetical protein
MIELVAAVHYQGSALDLLDKKIVKIHASIEQLPTLIVSMNTEAGRSSSNIDDINTNVDRSNALRDINNSLQNMVGHFDKQWRTLFDGLQKSHAQLSRQVVESGGTAESLADREECLAMLRSLVQYSKRVKSAIEAYSGGTYTSLRGFDYITKIGVL